LAKWAKKIGCGFYSWGTRRNKAKPDEHTDKNFVPYCFSTDMQESDIVFGGEKKLELESLEPSEPMGIQTPIGVIIAFDPNAVGINADSNSLVFNKNGNVTAITTVHDRGANVGGTSFDVRAARGRKSP
jgi:hypothetical protein